MAYQKDNVKFHGNIEWRFPDELGLYDRNLDCKQLAIKEILKLHQERNIPRVFLNPFDCRHEGLKITRKEPKLNRGWKIKEFPEISPLKVIELIKNTFFQHGYCLIYFDAYNIQFSSYYQKHDIVHWSLVTYIDDTHITLVDMAGDKKYFDGNTGKIQLSEFQKIWWDCKNGGIAYIWKDQYSKSNWENEFNQVIQTSVNSMLNTGGLDHFESFITNLKETDIDLLRKKLESMEFEIHYYRRLRELWKLAAFRGDIPTKFKKASWIEELIDSCTHWSLVMGILMKWKRQEHRDYQVKLVDYFEQILMIEKRLFLELTKV